MSCYRSIGSLNSVPFVEASGLFIFKAAMCWEVRPSTVFCPPPTLPHPPVLCFCVSVAPTRHPLVDTTGRHVLGGRRTDG